MLQDGAAKTGFKNPFGEIRYFQIKALILRWRKIVISSVLHDNILSRNLFIFCSPDFPYFPGLN